MDSQKKTTLHKGGLVAVLLWTGLIGYLLLTPARDLPPLFPNADKVVHFGLFFVHSFLVCLLYLLSVDRHRLVKKQYLIVVGTTLLFGLVTELLQSFVPGRTSDVLDFVFDGIGTATGTYFFYTGKKYFFD